MIALTPAQLQAILLHLLRPLVRYCLKNGFSIQDFTLVAKRAFVEEASTLLTQTTGSANSSRISALSGVHRN